MITLLAILLITDPCLVSMERLIREGKLKVIQLPSKPVKVNVKQEKKPK